jgi:hypothetical protein
LRRNELCDNPRAFVWTVIEGKDKVLIVVESKVREAFG